MPSISRHLFHLVKRENVYFASLDEINGMFVTLYILPLNSPLLPLPITLNLRLCKINGVFTGTCIKRHIFSHIIGL